MRLTGIQLARIALCKAQICARGLPSVLAQPASVQRSSLPLRSLLRHEPCLQLVWPHERARWPGDSKAGSAALQHWQPQSCSFTCSCHPAQCVGA